MAHADPQRFTAACIQMCSGREVEANIGAAEALIREAARGGAAFVLTPEMTSIVENDRQRLLKALKPAGEDLALKRLSALAGELGIWLSIGSLPVLAGEGRAANRSFLASPEGSVVAAYDKIHMFDVDLPGGEIFRESGTFKAGDTAVVAELPWGQLGMTVCYDLRFPHLYRALAQAGADFVSVPSAFTRQTGEAHWHALLKARAIENGVFVFAAAQGGRHESGRETYGHSMIVSPWGEILAEAGTEPGVIAAEIDVARVGEARGRIPSLSHGRRFAIEAPARGGLRVVS